MRLYFIIIILLSNVMVVWFIYRCRRLLDSKNIPLSRVKVCQQFVWTFLGGGFMVLMTLVCLLQKPINEFGACILIFVHWVGCLLLVRGFVRGFWVHPDKIIIQDTFGRTYVYLYHELKCYPRRAGQVILLVTPKTKYRISQKANGSNYLVRMVLKVQK